MELNVPETGTASHESPAVNQLHDETKVPVSEIKARLHDTVMDLNRKRLQNPDEVSYGSSMNDMREQAYKEVETQLTKPEETQSPEAEEFKNVFGDEYPGAEAFAAPVEGDQSADGGFGGGFGGGFDGGIDNSAMGFSDEDMSALDATAENAFDDYTNETNTETAADVNNLSATTPSDGGDGAPESVSMEGEPAGADDTEIKDEPEIKAD